MLGRRQSGRARLAGAGFGCLLLPLALAHPADAQIESPEPSPPSAAREDPDLSAILANVDRELAEIDALLASSHFHTALSVAKSTRELLRSFEGDSQLEPRRARLEVMAATAEIALARRAVAQQSMRRALQADPNLSLDARETSPKVISLLREARRNSDTGQPGP